MAIQPKIRITASEFYDLDAYKNDELIQLIDGEAVISVPPIPKQQAIVVETIFLFKTLAKTKGGSVYTSPIEVYLDNENIFEPDVLYIKPDSACKVEEKRLVGAPNLVVEVLSPSTAKFDRHQKYQAYEKHGVEEYWIIDPIHETLEVWIGKNTKFTRQGAYGKTDSFESQVLGETVEVKTLFES
jgi:Uma2 family endonuclease